MKTFILIFLMLLFWPFSAFSQFVRDITPSGLNTGDLFGYAVDISGSTAIVGSPNDDTNGFNSGAVYFFEKNGNSWQQTVKAFGADITQDQGFAESVAISGNHALVGAQYDNDMGSNSGAVYVFSKTNGGWVQSQKVYAGNPGDYNNFGFSLDIHDNWAVVGALYADIQGITSPGAVYLFKFTGDEWQLKQMLYAPDYAQGDQFGYSVAVSDNFIAVGAIGDDDKGGNSGSVYVFEQKDYHWKFKDKITAADGAIGDQFGYSVALSGDHLVASTINDDDLGNNSGAVYLFDLSQDDALQLDKVIAFDGQAGENFGSDVDIYNESVLVGCRYSRAEGLSNAGAAYYYKIKSGHFILQKKLLDNPASVYDNFGFSVAISDRFIIAGIPYKDFDDGMVTINSSGGANIYDANYFAPIITSAADVANDEGGYVNLTWECSLLDNAAHELTHYSIWRSLTGNNSLAGITNSQSLAKDAANTYRISTINGISTAFEKVGEQDAHFLQEYAYSAPTSADQTTNWFMVSYHTSDPTLFYDSEPFSGTSSDNLAPLSPPMINIAVVDNTIELDWPASETADLKHYQVYRASAVEELALMATVKENHFTDGAVAVGLEYYYAVSAVDSSGNESEQTTTDPLVFAVTALQQDGQTAQHFDLQQNYPNPFNPTTTIRYTVGTRHAVSVQVSVYNLLGKKVTTLVDKQQSAGSYQLQWDGSGFTSGVYYIKMEAGVFSSVKKAVLMK